MRNLFDETVEILNEHRHTLEEIVWVGCKDFRIPKEIFIKLACNTDYDEHSGVCVIPLDLFVVGKDFFLERVYEREGAEEKWVYHYYPPEPASAKLVYSISSKDGLSDASLKDFVYTREGRWINLGHLMRPLDHPWSEWYKCSVCGYEQYVLMGSGITETCPNCGSVLEEVENHDRSLSLCLF